MNRTSIFGFGDQGNTVIRTPYMDSPLRFELKTRAPETLVLPLHHGEIFTSSEPPQASKSFFESSEEHQSPQSSCHSLEASDSVPLELQYRLTYILLLSLRILPHGASIQSRTGIYTLGECSVVHYTMPAYKKRIQYREEEKGFILLGPFLYYGAYSFLGFIRPCRSSVLLYSGFSHLRPSPILLHSRVFAQSLFSILYSFVKEYRRDK